MNNAGQYDRTAGQFDLFRQRILTQDELHEWCNKLLEILK